MFHSFLVTMVPLKNGMNLRENATYMKIHILNGYNQLYPRNMENYYKKTYENATNLIIYNHHIIKSSRVITLDKLTSCETYSILISKFQIKPSSNIYVKNRFYYYNIDRTAIYMLPHLVAYNTYMQSFQYKILKNVLFLKKKLLE